MTSIHPRWMILLACCANGAASVPLAAQSTRQAQAPPEFDRVWIAPPSPTRSQSHWYPRAIETSQGRIDSLDDQALRLIVAGDEVETVIASHRVIWIEPATVGPQQQAALRMFADRQYDQSLRPLLDALTERPPVWRQQWLSMLAAQAAYRSGRGAIALELVSQLDQRPLPVMTLAWLPIHWSNRVVPAQASSPASARLNDPSPAVRLIAASWLLAGNQRESATSTLEQLSVLQQRPWLAQLAESQLWKVSKPDQVPGKWRDWLAKTDALPVALQVGPTITMIDKLRSTGQAEAAKHLERSLQLTPPIPHPDLQTIQSDPEAVTGEEAK